MAFIGSTWALVVNRFLQIAAATLIACSPAVGQVVTQPAMADDQAAAQAAELQAAPAADTRVGSDRVTQEQQRQELIEQAYDAYLEGELETAVEKTEKLYRLARELYGDSDDRVRGRLDELALFHLELEQPAVALDYARQAEALTREAYPATDWRVADAKENVELVDALTTLPRTRRQRFLDAQRQVELASEVHDTPKEFQLIQYRIEVLIELLGERRLTVVEEMLSLQHRLIQQGKILGVDRRLARLEKLTAQISQPPNTVLGQLYFCWATLAEAQEEPQAAEEYYQKAILAFSAAGSLNHPDYAIVHNNLAVMLDIDERYEEALHHYQIASKLWREQLGGGDHNYERMIDNLVRLQRTTGLNALDDRDWELAAERLRDGIANVLATWGADDYRLPELRADLRRVGLLKRMAPMQLDKYDQTVELNLAANAATDEGDWDKANTLQGERRDLVYELFGPNSYEGVLAQFDYAWTLPDGEESVTALEALLEPLRQTIGDRHPEYARLLKELARQFDEPDKTALDRITRAAEIYANAGGKDDRDYLSALCLQGRILAWRADRRAETVLQEACTRLEALGETDILEYANALSDLGGYYQQGGWPIKALEPSTKAVAVARKIPDFSASELATLLNELANAYFSIERYDEAIDLYVESVDLERNAEDRSECDFCMSLYNVGELFFAREQFAEALPYYQELLAVCQEGDSICFESCFDGGISLAASHRRLEQYEEARQALDDLQTLLGSVDASNTGLRNEFTLRIAVQHMAIDRDVGDLTTARERVASIWQQLDPGAARQSNPDASAIHRRGPGAAGLDPYDWSGLLTEVANLAQEVNETAVMLAAREAYAEFAEEFYSDEPWLVADARCELAEARREAALSPEQRDELADANALWDRAYGELSDEAGRANIGAMEQAFAIKKRLLGEDHREVIVWQIDLGAERRDVGRIEQAYADFLQAANLRRNLLGQRHEDTADAQIFAAVAARRTGRLAKAEELLQEALTTRTLLYGPEHTRLAEIYHSLAILYLDMGRYASALAPAIEARDRFRLGYGEESFDYANSLRTLYGVYDSLDEYGKALTALLESHNIYKKLCEP
ncbi:MAG: tetratricopeptide repeat protein, partial [Planctomycetota bacterium]